MIKINFTRDNKGGGTVGPNHKSCAMNIKGPKYFTAVFGKQMGPRHRMDSKGPQPLFRNNYLKLPKKENH